MALLAASTRCSLASGIGGRREAPRHLRRHAFDALSPLRDEAFPLPALSSAAHGPRIEGSMSTARRVVPSFFIHADGICRAGCSHEPPNAEQVEACRAWLRTYAQPRKTFNRRSSSYGLKHDVERDSDGHLYVSNGAFLKAALLEGYRIEPIGDGPNGRLNIALPDHPEHSRSARQKDRSRARLPRPQKRPLLRLIIGGRR